MSSSKDVSETYDLVEKDDFNETIYVTLGFDAPNDALYETVWLNKKDKGIPDGFVAEYKLVRVGKKSTQSKLSFK